MHTNRSTALWGLLLSASLMACETTTGKDSETIDTNDTGETTEEPDIAGSYTDQYGSTHVVQGDTWVVAFEDATDTFNIAYISNEDMFLIAQNDEGNVYFPGLWSRFDWVTSGTDVYYCQSAYDAADQDEALATPRGDDTDPANAGCGGGFPWTLLNASR